MVKDFLDRNRNINDRRINLLTAKPAHGEPFSIYGERLLYLADQAELDKISSSELLSLSAFHHYNDDKLKERIVRAEAETNLRDAIKIARQEEKVRATLATNKRKEEKLAGLRTGGNQRTSKVQGGRNNTQKPKQCYKCGAHHHQWINMQIKWNT